jgi:hypothetical protein
MEFDPDTTIAPLGTLVVLSFNPAKAGNEARVAAFRDFYGIDESVPLVGGYDGGLSNGGEQVRLERPGEPPTDEPYFVPRYLEDEVDYDDVPPWPTEADGNGRSLHRLGPGLFGNEAGNWVAADPSPGTVPYVSEPLVVGRHVFYNHSAFDGQSTDLGAEDDAAIATDKEALRPGRTAEFKNYTSYARGINGIMVDVAHPDAEPTLADFEFAVGNGDDPGDWTAAPAPTGFAVRPGAGVSHSDRVTLAWSDYAIRGQWLRVSLPSGTPIGLSEPAVFYFGNAVGESGNEPADAMVTGTDLVLARNNPHNFLNAAAVEYPYDYNRDGHVNSTDIILARNNATNVTTSLKLLDLSDNPPLAQPPASEASALEQLAWLDALEQTDREEPLPRKRDPYPAAVDLVLTAD